METATISRLESLIRDFRDTHLKGFEELLHESQKVADACHQIARSWSGSFAGWHGSMYYKNFKIPPLRERFNGEWGALRGLPEGWRERQPEEVAAEIERRVGQNFALDEFEHKINGMRKSAEALHREILVIFSAHV